MERGEVWWALLDEKPPVVLLSRDGVEDLRAIQVVAPAGTDISGVGIEVRLGSKPHADGHQPPDWQQGHLWQISRERLLTLPSAPTWTMGHTARFRPG